MTAGAPLSLKQLCIGFCMVLAFVFAGVSAAKVLDGIQHLPSGAVHHVHSSLGLATIAFDDGHEADHHDDADHDDGERNGNGGEQPTHHHHADGSSGLIATAAADTPPMRATPGRLTTPRQRLPLGLALHGPERPPRSTCSLA